MYGNRSEALLPRLIFELGLETRERLRLCSSNSTRGRKKLGNPNNGRGETEHTWKQDSVLLLAAVQIPRQLVEPTEKLYSLFVDNIIEK